MTFILNGILVIVSVLSFMTYNFIAVRQSAVFTGLAVSDTDIAIVADAQVPLGDGLQTTDGGAGEVNVTAISMMEDKDYAGMLYFPALKLELPVCDDDTPENVK